MITYGALSKAVGSTLKNANIFTVFQQYDELTEAIPTTPLGRCYPDEGNVDFGGESVDRTTFQVGVRGTQMTITIDCYARARSQLAHDIKAQIDLIDAVDAVLVAQKTQPFFGIDGIKAFSWSWERTTFQHEATQYAGAEFKLSLIVF